jgi:glycyl-tRNA synthetase beta chain
MTQMVGEFPELQGQMGEHYARASGEPETVARAIGEHYAPRFAGDTIPQTPAGLVLSLADRADTLVACFAAGLAPSGNKDPFALRRAALGLVRILNEGEWEQVGEAAPFQPLVPLRTLFGWAADNLDSRLPVKPGVLDEVIEFVVQRSRGYFADQGFGAELLNAALGSNWAHIPDLRKRLVAVNAFTDLPEAASLAQANKRIGNILRKAEDDVADSVDESALELDEESRLFAAVVRKKAEIAPLLERGDYHSSLKALAALDKPVNDFFDGVMVMDEDPVKRRNRLALLASLKSMFDEIADLSVLG